MEFTRWVISTGIGKCPYAEVPQNNCNSRKTGKKNFAMCDETASTTDKDGRDY